jgi:phage-related protein
MITFNGKNSDEYKIIVEHYPSFTVPKRSYKTVSVPGRSGDICIDNGRWENVTAKYKIALDGHSVGYAAAYDLAAEFIGQTGYQRLEDTYDTSVYRLAMVSNDTEIENHLMEMGRGTLEFDCMPQRWLKTGETPVLFSASGTIKNPTGYDSKPLIKVVGTGAGTVTIGANTVTLNKLDDYLYIDCESENVYRERNEDRNSYMNLGEYPIITSGTSNVSFAGLITSIEITPRWWRL